MCTHFFKGDFKFKWPPQSSWFLFLATCIFSNWKKQRNVLINFCKRMLFFFEGSFISDSIFFSVSSSARDSQIIFRSLAIILLDVLAIGFLLFAHHCSLFAVRWLSLAARFLFLTNARWSFVLRYSPLARSFPIAALLSLVAAAFSLIASLSRYTLLMTLQAARLSLPVNRSKPLTISDLAFFCSGKGPSLGP